MSFLGKLWFVFFFCRCCGVTVAFIGEGKRRSCGGDDGGGSLVVQLVFGLVCGHCGSGFVLAAAEVAESKGVLGFVRDSELTRSR